MTDRKTGKKIVLVLQIVIFVLFGLCLPIVMMVFGGMNLKNCQRQYLIPIYLVVFGCTYLVGSIFLMLSMKKLFTILIFTIIFGLFNLAWLICGSVWVFGTEDDYDASPRTVTVPPSNKVVNNPRYCDDTMHEFAFVVTIIYYIVPVIQVILYFVALDLEKDKDDLDYDNPHKPDKKDFDHKSDKNVKK